MKITSRELILLFSLVGVVLLYILYTFLFNPLLMDVSIAREELNAVQTQQISVDEYANIIPELIQQQRVKSLEAGAKVEEFLPDLNEDLLTTFFVTTVTKGGPVINNLAFDAVNPINLDSLIPIPVAPIAYTYGDIEKIANPLSEGEIYNSPQPGDGDPSKQVLVRGVSLNFGNTTYEQAIIHLKTVEALKRTIILDTLILSNGEGGLEGTLHYTFLGLDKLNDEDKGLPKTPITDGNGTTNPFN